MKEDSEEKLPSKVTDIPAAQDNIDAAVTAFADRWISLPCMSLPCEVMDQGQLRDAMGLHATIDLGDPWPQAEKLLIQMGFRWHNLGSSRVMFLREREDAVIDNGWTDGEEVKK
jgi:hypothetical protein